ncbi:MAG: ribonuclease P protein component [Chloroflexi bacterium]|jgi:ribonuclease P protein component|nr:ribonuclease P protein component [Chloroflexota bacterium]
MPGYFKLATLRSSHEISAIRKEGKTYSNRYFVLVVRANTLQISRYAVIASRSVGGAVERNRCKRRIRSRVAKLASKLTSGFDLLIIARIACLTVEPKILDKAFEQVYDQAGLIDRHV